MSAAAEFPSPVAEGDDANPLPVLLVEKRNRTGGDRLFKGQFLNTPHKVGADFLVQKGGYAVDLLGRQRARKTKVEGRVVRLNRGAGLDRFLTQDVPQRAVQEVRGRMMHSDRLASGRVHRRAHTGSGLQPCGSDPD